MAKENLVDRIREMHNSFSGTLDENNPFLNCGKFVKNGICKSCCEREYLVHLLPGEEIVVAERLGIPAEEYEKKQNIKTLIVPEINVTFSEKELGYELEINIEKHKQKFFYDGCIVYDKDKGCSNEKAKNFICKAYPFYIGWNYDNEKPFAKKSFDCALTSRRLNKNLTKETRERMNEFGKKVRKYMEKMQIPDDWYKTLSLLEDFGGAIYDSDKVREITQCKEVNLIDILDCKKVDPFYPECFPEFQYILRKIKKKLK